MTGMATAVTYQESKRAFQLALFGESAEGAEAFESYWKILQERTVEPPMLNPVPLDKGGSNQITAVMNADKLENIKWPDLSYQLGNASVSGQRQCRSTLGLVRVLDLHSRLRNSQLVIQPNSGHGSLWQYAALFAERVNLFLDSDAFDSNH
jgi:pimeloyl-ACP methyl ester carboxylesterase